MQVFGDISDTRPAKVGLLLAGVCLASALAGGCHSAESGGRFSLWVDATTGEPVSFEEVVEDLSGADVTYLGERHTVERHHRVQTEVIHAFGKKGHALVIGLEQVEAVHQPSLDRYAEGELTFEQLAREIRWSEQWGNHLDYKPVLEAGRQYSARFLGLNARKEIIRKIGRRGLASLSAEERKQLPRKMNTSDRVYSAHLRQAMGVMVAAMPQRIAHIVHAQIVRDETMAAALCAFLTRPVNQRHKAIVVCGIGHVNYGLGTAQRVRRRLPDVNERIVLLSGSGDVKLSERAKKMARDVEITHEQTRQVPTRIADYLHVTNPAPR